MMIIDREFNDATVDLQSLYFALKGILDDTHAFVSFMPLIFLIVLQKTLDLNLTM